MGPHLGFHNLFASYAVVTELLGGWKIFGVDIVLEKRDEMGHDKHHGCRWGE